MPIEFFVDVGVVYRGPVRSGHVLRWGCINAKREQDQPEFEPCIMGLNHMAWRMASLEKLFDFYNNLKEKNLPIQRVSDHGLSLGIYIKDPGGTGIEVYYKTPREEWHRQDNLLMSGDRPQGNFPGPGKPIWYRRAWPQHRAAKPRRHSSTEAGRTAVRRHTFAAAPDSAWIKVVSTGGRFQTCPCVLVASGATGRRQSLRFR